MESGDVTSRGGVAGVAEEDEPGRGWEEPDEGVMSSDLADAVADESA